MTRSHKNRKKNGQNKKNLNKKLLIIPLIFIVSIIIISAKNTSRNNDTAVETLPASAISSSTEFVGQPTPTISVQESPEQRFDRLFSEKKPIFAFFHSNNCQKCLDMIEVVEVVYPEFEEKIFLVDVNVYDPINQNFLKRANIHAIPTQYFFDSKGTINQVIGLMTETELKDALFAIIGE